MAPNNNKEEKDKAVYNVYSLPDTNTGVESASGSRVYSIHTVYNNKPETNTNKEQARSNVYNNKNNREDSFEKDYEKILYNTTDVLCIRVPLIYKYYYKQIRANLLLYKVFKDTILELIKTYVQQGRSIIDMAQEAHGKIHISLNPHIIINNVKAEARAENRVIIDTSSLLAELEEIKKLVYNWYRMGAIPKAAFDNVSTRIKKIEKLLKGVN